LKRGLLPTRKTKNGGGEKELSDSEGFLSRNRGVAVISPGCGREETSRLLRIAREEKRQYFWGTSLKIRERGVTFFQGRIVSRGLREEQALLWASTRQQSKECARAREESPKTSW